MLAAPPLQQPHRDPAGVNHRNARPGHHIGKMPQKHQPTVVALMICRDTNGTSVEGAGNGCEANAIEAGRMAAVLGCAREEEGQTATMAAI